jgi:hypothetical protein
MSAARIAASLCSIAWTKNQVYPSRAAKSSNLGLWLDQEVFLAVQQEGADRLAVFGCEFDRIRGKMRSGTLYLAASFDRVSPDMLDKGASIDDCENACDGHHVILGRGSNGIFQRTLYVRRGYLDLFRTDHAQSGLPLYRLPACHLRPSHCIPGCEPRATDLVG